MTKNTKSRLRRELGGKRLKDVDSAGQCLVLNTFCKIFPLLVILELVAGGTIGLLVAAGFSVLAAFLCVGAAEGVGGLSANLLNGTGWHGWSLREQLEGDLSRLRVHKMNGWLEQALSTVEEILARDAAPGGAAAQGANPQGRF